MIATNMCSVVKAKCAKVAMINPLSANPIKWSNILKQFVGFLPTNCLSVFDHIVGLAVQGLTVLLYTTTCYISENEHKENTKKTLLF